MIAPEKERSERENGDRPRFIQYRSLGKRLDQEWETVVCPRFCLNKNLEEVIAMLLEDGEPKLESEFIGIQNVAVA